MVRLNVSKPPKIVRWRGEQRVEVQPAVLVELATSDPLHAAMPLSGPVAAVDASADLADENPESFIRRFRMHRTVVARSVSGENLACGPISVEPLLSKSESCEDVCGVSPEKVSPRIANTRIRVTVQLRLVRKYNVSPAALPRLCSCWRGVVFMHGHPLGGLR